MRFLPDVNVWVSIVLLNHASHPQALAWFKTLGAYDHAFFCRSTQQGFLRLLTNRAIFGRLAVSNEVAWKTYQTLRKDSRVAWIDEPFGLDDQWAAYARRPQPSPHVWMDAYLAAMARLHRLHLVSFDQGFRAYAGLDRLELDFK